MMKDIEKFELFLQNTFKIIKDLKSPESPSVHTQVSVSLCVQLYYENYS